MFRLRIREQAVRVPAGRVSEVAWSNPTAWDFQATPSGVGFRGGMYGRVEVDTGAALTEACELLHSLHDRCMRREAVRADETADDHEWTRTDNGVYVLPVREGFLLRYPQGAKWCLTMRWCGDYGERVLCCGTLADIERLAREIQRYGPPGGPVYLGGPLRWRRFDDATWHVATSDGELRLMPSKGNDQHLLLHVRNDRAGAFAVVGVGDPEELQDDIEANSGELGYVRISIAGRPRYLRCIGADRALGILENGDDRFVLGYWGGDLFQLVCQTGAEVRFVRAYTLEQVQRGDLGPVMAWAHEDAPPKPSAPVQEHEPAEMPHRTSGVSQPVGLAVEVSNDTSRRKLQGLERQHVLAHLTPEAPPTGPASTIIPLVYAALRMLVQRGYGDRLLWAHEVQDLLNECPDIRIHCCTKILNLALRAVAMHTPILERRGRRWLLRFGELRKPDSAILQSIVRTTALLDDVETATVDPPPRRSPGPPGHQVRPPGSWSPSIQTVTPPPILDPRDGNDRRPVERETPRTVAASATSGRETTGPSVAPSATPGSITPPGRGGGNSKIAGPTERVSAFSSAPPEAVASGLPPGWPHWAATRETLREWLDESMQRALQIDRSPRRPRLREPGLLFSGSLPEGGALRWTRFRRQRPP